MNATAVVEHRESAPAISLQPAPNPVMDMIRQAIAAGQPLDLAVIREIKDLAKEMASDEAERAFNAAFASFKSEVVVVNRTREVTDGPLKGRRYAELHSFVDAATPALAKNGLSHSWSVTRDEKDWIEVTCTIEHSLGGRKLVKQGGPPDAGGAKNALQARISTVTYLERATFKAICGLAEQGDDDDGQAAGAAVTISEDQLSKLRALIDDVGGDVAKLCAHFKIEALPDLPISKLPEAIGIVELKRQQGTK
jgi:hypothetical protein